MWRPGGDRAAQLRTQGCRVYLRHAPASMTALQHSSISPHHPPACAACVLLPLAPAAAAQLLAGAASISGSQRCYCEVHDAATTLQARSK